MIKPYANNAKEHLCDGPIYTWFAGTKAKTIYSAIEEVGDLHSLIIWVKNGGYGAMNANYKQKHEPCLYWKKKGGKLNFVGATTETTIWNIDKDGINKLHPTQKPIALALKAIMNHSVGRILDLFLGSGSTLIASEKTGRICYGMELDEHYIDIIVQRWVDFTGNENIKLNGEEIIWNKTQKNLN
jgi:DNA modification methylase